jgi:hypothetical protein
MYGHNNVPQLLKVFKTLFKKEGKKWFKNAQHLLFNPYHTIQHTISRDIKILPFRTHTFMLAMPFAKLEVTLPLHLVLISKVLRGQFLTVGVAEWVKHIKGKVTLQVPNNLS